MKTARIVIVVFCFTASLLAQTAHTQIASMRLPLGKAGGDSASSSDRLNLDATMFDLQRITVATNSDIADLQVEKWRAGWRSAWLKDVSQKQEAEKMAASLQHNLADAMPGLISEVQNSHGSVSSAFKLYNDLNIVVESLDSLIAATKSFGRKGESGPLANDSAALGRLRQDISSYIQTTAVSLETRTRVPSALPPSGTPKKIIVDDNVPSSKTRKRSAALNH